MKNKFKKAIASVMAITTLAVGVTGMSTSAYGGGTSFGNGYATLDVSNTSLYATTLRYNSNDYMSVNIYDHDGNASSSLKGNVTNNSNKCYHQILGSGFTYARSEHHVGNASTYLSV